MAKVSSKPTKGTRDFLPRDVHVRSHVTGIIEGVFRAHGFEPLQTPALERLDTLMGKYGEEGDQLLFKLLLRGQPLVRGIRAAAEHLTQPGAVVEGRSGETAPAAEPLLADLGLRYDLTVPLARVYAAYQGKLPSIFKRYQIQPVWRADTPGKGRFREFYQCDVDVCGSTSRAVEAEVLSAAAACLQALGFDDFALRLNHRGLLRALIDVAGIPAALETEAIIAIDKLDKLGSEGVGKELTARGVQDAARDKLLGILGQDASLAGIREHMRGHAEGEAAVADIEQVLALCGVTPAAAHVKFDVTLARGLGYYTGCIFEIAVPDLAGSLGGGGRYDGLIGMFLGKQVPACGLSLGLERILVVMEERGMLPAEGMGPELVVGFTDEAGLPGALGLCTALRQGGLRVDLRPQKMKPGKLRQFAEAQGIGAAAWLEGDGAGGLSLHRFGDGDSDGNSTQHGMDAQAVLAAIGADAQPSTLGGGR